MTVSDYFVLSPWLAGCYGTVLSQANSGGPVVDLSACAQRQTPV